jgi:hypothetical protein
MLASTLLALVPIMMASRAASQTYTPTIVEPAAPVLVKTAGKGKLYSLSAEGYTPAIWLLDVSGSRYDMGYAYGVLMGNESVWDYDTFAAYLAGNATWAVELANAFFDYEYENYLSKQTPQDYKDEFEGMQDGGLAIGNDRVGVTVQRMYVVASMAVGAVPYDILILLRNQWQERHRDSDSFVLKETFAYMTEHKLSFEDIQNEFWGMFGEALNAHCSIWGAWGPRTDEGSLFTGRNLDWLAQSGLTQNKLLTIFRPDGKIPHVTIGFAGITGALTGLSAKGLSVHEAGDDNNLESLEGFGWPLRVRYVMEEAVTLEEAGTVWNSTNNTMGLNHGFGSGADNEFVVLETVKGYSAFFGPNDPREAANPYGAPLENAVWRTNHGYDPVFLETAFHQTPGRSSELRYHLIGDTISGYEDEGVAIGTLQAVNITSVVGYKSRRGEDLDSFYNCSGAETSAGNNVISAAYQPGTLQMYVAWEDGFGDSHVPACCNSYVHVDMTTWF